MIAIQVFCEPSICVNCQYIGEGDFVCTEINKLVIDDWIPTDSFIRECPINSE